MSEKVFVIGFNKTGTTSVKSALFELGYKIGDQSKGEKLLPKIKQGKYKKLMRYVKTAEAFQDVPFSLPGVYKKLYQEYPEARFILTIRDSKKQWFQSISNFHSKVFGEGGKPTKEELQKANYCYKGMIWDYIDVVFNGILYEEKYYSEAYEGHILDVMKFFEKNEGNLCVINTAIKKDYFRMCRFLEKTPVRESFEWKNKTADK